MTFVTATQIHRRARISSQGCPQTELFDRNALSHLASIQ
jgi:hypothetical protein